MAPRKGGKEQRSRIASPKGQLNGVAQLLSHHGTEVPKMGKIELDREEEQRKKNGEERREGIMRVSDEGGPGGMFGSWASRFVDAKQ